jgi:hypothetical protein
MLPSGEILVAGRINLQEPQPAAIYNVATNNWRSVPPVDQEAWGPTLVTLGTRVFHLGSDVVEEFDYKNERWCVAFKISQLISSFLQASNTFDLPL